MLLTFTACKTESIAGDILTISIPQSKEKTIIPLDRYVQSIDTIILKDNAQCSGLVDVTIMNQNHLFLLDNSKQIMKFRTSDGILENVIKTVGTAKNEYISPQSITSDANNVYVLDFAGRSILKFDADLSFVKKIKINDAILDFAKVDGGFLLYSLTGGKHGKQIIYMNDKGEVQEGYIDYNPNIDAMASTKIFSENNAAGICLISYEDNIIYCWKNHNLIPITEFIYDKELGRYDGHITNIFESNNLIFAQYASNDIIRTSLYDKNKHTTSSGIVKFCSPQCIYNDVLYEVLDTKDFSDNDEERLLLKRYYLK